MENQTETVVYRSKEKQSKHGTEGLSCSRKETADHDHVPM